jgi:hypothetical protein
MSDSRTEEREQREWWIQTAMTGQTLGVVDTHDESVRSFGNTMVQLSQRVVLGERYDALAARLAEVEAERDRAVAGHNRIEADWAVMRADLERAREALADIAGETDDRAVRRIARAALAASSPATTEAGT